MADIAFAHSCTFCEHLFLSPYEGRWHVFNTTINALKSVGARNCEFAQALLEPFERISKKPSKGTFTAEGLSQYGDLRVCANVLVGSSINYPDISSFGLLSSIDKVEGDNEKFVCRTFIEHPMELRLYTTEGISKKKTPEQVHQFRSPPLILFAIDDPTAVYVSPRPIDQAIFSKQLSKTWLNECLHGTEAHPHCKRLVQSFMPTRVLSLSHVDDGIRLVNTRIAEPYVALSYCWGGAQPHMLTTNTINDYEIAIDHHQLPATIQDAVKVTIEMGLSYLWVDSLCIIQDDPIDLAREIAQMPGIYSQATVTICASRTGSVSGGFLGPRNLEKMFKPPFKLCFQCPDGNVGTVYLAQLRHPRDATPLATRAWALQERLLSPRVLDFNPLQTRWLCNSIDTDEARNWGRLFSRFRYDNIITLRRLLPDEEPPLSTTIEAWRYVVMVYTGRLLTDPKDRILAISGLAERFNRRLQDTYLAGLWKCALPWQLLWFANNAELNTRPTEFQGPSWSWTAVKGLINFYSEAEPKSISSIGVLNIEIVLSESSAPYGAVKSGILSVKGRLCAALWDGKRTFAEQSREVYREVAAKNSDALRPDCRDEAISMPSVPENDLSVSFLTLSDGQAMKTSADTLGVDTFRDAKVVRVFLLEVCVQEQDDYKGGNYWRTFGLVLRRLENNERQQYSRIGMFEIAHPDQSSGLAWKDHTVIQII